MTTNDGLESVQELTGSETGRWLVITRDSSHLFDFDAGTVLRIPGPAAQAGVNDRPRSLRKIDECSVGARGFWTMNADEGSATIEYWWASTSVIQEIRRMPTSQ